VTSNFRFHLFKIILAVLSLLGLIFFLVAYGEASRLASQAQKTASAPLAAKNGWEEPLDVAPKYFWTIDPSTDKTLANTHATVGAPGCDLAPGLECSFELRADAEGKLRIPVQWRRPAGSESPMAVVSHMAGPSFSTHPRGVVVSGFAPGATARFKVAMGVFANYANEPATFKRVFRDGAGMIDCQDSCLLMFGAFKTPPAQDTPLATPAWLDQKNLNQAFGFFCLAMALAWAGALLEPRARIVFGRPPAHLALPARKD
jgi:hypothetical protein